MLRPTLSQIQRWRGQGARAEGEEEEGKGNRWGRQCCFPMKHLIQEILPPLERMRAPFHQKQICSPSFPLLLLPEVEEHDVTVPHLISRPLVADLP